MDPRYFKPMTAAAAAVALALGVAACSSDNDTNTQQPSTSSGPTARTVSMDFDVPVTNELLDGLESQDNSATLEIGAGQSDTREGVVFECKSKYPCTIELTRNLGKVEANWKTRTDAEDKSGDNMLVVAKLPPGPDPEEIVNRLNPANPSIIVSAFSSTFDSKDKIIGWKDAKLDSTVLEGIGPEDLSGVTLEDRFTSASGAKKKIGGKGKDGGKASELDLPKWDQRVMFRDWGDTEGDEDAGFETGALIYSNVENPKEYKFDKELVNHIADDKLKKYFQVTDGMIQMAVSDAQFVKAVVPTGARRAFTFDADERKNGIPAEYLGVKGTLNCADGTADDDCRIVDVGGVRTGARFQINSKTGLVWTFKPDKGATIMLPDQDWLAFGVWATVPNDQEHGEHFGDVFFYGQNEVGVENSLGGKATYEGSATGLYVDRDVSNGMFVARAKLTANFNGGMGKLTGRIDNFKDSHGRYIGRDSSDNPNDPFDGGDSDWIVRLEESDLNKDGTSEGEIGGAADGVKFADGEWASQFYGVDDLKEQPTGVAGKFMAATHSAYANNEKKYRGVVGAFGAER